MKIEFVVIIAIFGLFSMPCECAKILGIIPTASFSHQIPFRPIWRELSLRGHQVTVMTTDPMNDPTLTNLTEIDMHYTHELMNKYNFSEIASDESKSFMEIGKLIVDMFDEATDAQLRSPEVQNLLYNKNVTFDLLIIEAHLPNMLGFSWRFKCPWIGVASLDAAMQFHDSAGNPTHPLINPDNNLPIENRDNMSFKERLISFVYNTAYKFKVYHRYYPRLSKSLKKFFGDDLPPLVDIQNNISMLFVSTNIIFHKLRPLNPNTITIGNGLHLTPPKALPKDLKKFLDESKNGVVYFSLGSNIKGGLLNESMKQEILSAFFELPYNFVMKFDGELKNVPENVRVEKWIPQQDLLRHPNIKLFISQGGLQSLQESIINSIPLVCIPYFGDQFTNVQKVIKNGFGVKIDRKQVTKEALKAAVIEVITNHKYRDAAKEMGELLMDEPMTSLDTAIWWIEYVIRHKGAPHLKSLATHMPFWKYHLLDVLLVIGIIGFVCAYVTCKIMKYILGKIFNRKIKKEKKQ